MNRLFSSVSAVALALASPAFCQTARVSGADVATSLPQPDFHFKGQVGRTMQDSDPPTFPQPARPAEGAPNIVLILLDDVGFGQFSVFGGGVPSPAMEKLAANGVKYNRFHTTALCSPTRAALLTGRNHQSAATGVIQELSIGYDGYTGILPKSTGTFAEVLRQNGYATAWLGKNHNTPPWETSEIGPFDRWPSGLGFDYFYGHNTGDTSQYEPIFFENRDRVPRSSDPTYHVSTDIADKSIAWMRKVRAIDPSRPFLLYIAPPATHAPHQAPPEWIDRFKGRFDMGWDRYREAVFERQKRIGVVPADAKLTPRPDSLPAWDSLNADQKRLYARMMEVFAGFGAHIDHEIGRVLDAVAKLPDADNTMVIYMLGDNGASAEGGLPGSTNENAFFNSIVETWQDNLKVIDELGGPKHYNHFPAGWAHAMNTPFRWTKQVASHFGGVRNPMIVSWPKRIGDKGGVRTQFHHVVDIAPTILEAAGLSMPDTLNGIAQKPIEGVSMAYTFGDASARDRRRTQYFEMFANRGICHDGWCAGSLAFVPWDLNRGAFDIDAAPWELYNIDRDFSQADNLAGREPRRLQALKDLWWAEASRYQVLPVNWGGSERFSAELTGRPSLAAGRTSFTYDTPLVALPEGSSPSLKNKSFSVTAEAEIPASGAEGMIFTQGGVTAGWGFYGHQGRLVGVHNYVGLDRYRIVSSEPVPGGKVTLGMRFAYDGDGFGKGGTLTLLANGKPIGEGRVEKTTPFQYGLYEGQDIGEDAGSPVDFSYQPPFKFTGKLGKVTVELQPDGVIGRALK